MDPGLQEASERRRKRPREEGGAPAESPYAGGGAILRGHGRPVYGLDFSLDERLLLSASGDGTVRLWSTEIGANLAAYRHVLLHFQCAADRSALAPLCKLGTLFAAVVWKR